MRKYESGDIVFINARLVPRYQSDWRLRRHYDGSGISAGLRKLFALVYDLGLKGVVVFHGLVLPPFRRIFTIFRKRKFSKMNAYCAQPWYNCFITRNKNNNGRERKASNVKPQPQRGAGQGRQVLHGWQRFSGRFPERQTGGSAGPSRQRLLP